MIRRILCTTNLQASSQDSVGYGFRLAKENGAELMIFYAAAFPSLSQYACEIDDYLQWERLAAAFRLEQLLADAEQRARHFVDRRFASEKNGVIWRVKVTLGDAAEEIVRASFQEEADLIVMGRCKRGRLARLFGRSVPERVVRSAPCPVLSIDATQFYYPAGGWRLPGLRELFENG